ncbi:MAG TPA: hypothetical protein VE591_04015 [Candidatus Acidoferrum sp.]|nr:hypothetical protein [Candidatus Acidoferrum sp.]
MATPRKRSVSKARKGTAGKRKTAARKTPKTKPRTRHSPPVEAAVGPSGPKRKRPPTKRASSRRRAAEKGESLSPKPPRQRTDLTQADVAKIPGLARARARDLGEDAE